MSNEISVRRRAPAAEPAPRHSAADPSGVWCTGDLLRELDRLRDAGPLARAEGRRVSLQRLATATGLPRSSIHGYLSGRSVLPVDVLDRLVLALGAQAREAAEWAEAWQRAVDASRGGRSSDRGAGASWVSDLLRRAGQDNPALAGPIDQGAHVVMTSDRVQMGADRRIRHLDIRSTIRAHESGVARWIVRYPAGQSLPDAQQLELDRTVGCTVAEHHDLVDFGMRAFVLELDQTLHAGEVHTFGFRVPFAEARERSSVRSPEVTRALPTCTEAMRGFRDRGVVYGLEVHFAADDVPTDVRQIYLPHPDAEEERVGSVRVTGQRRSTIALESPAPGLHGIRWSWQ